MFLFLLRKARLSLAAVFALTATTSWSEPLTVFAAASLKEALEDIVDVFELEKEEEILLSFAGSSALARQIELGAPADVFISANGLWMDHLGNRGLLIEESRMNLAGNRLVIVSRKEAAPLDRASGADIVSALDGGRLAMALVDAVPAGIYGKAALHSLGAWQEVAPFVAQTDNVRAALALVAWGEAPLGIVYASDALASDKVDTVFVFPQDSHPEIAYPAAIIRQGQETRGQALLNFFGTEKAQNILSEHGFLPPQEPRND